MTTGEVSTLKTIVILDRDAGESVDVGAQLVDGEHAIRIAPASIFKITASQRASLVEACDASSIRAFVVALEDRWMQTMDQLPTKLVKVTGDDARAAYVAGVAISSGIGRAVAGTVADAGSRTSASVLVADAGGGIGGPPPSVSATLSAPLAPALALPTVAGRYVTSSEPIGNTFEERLDGGRLDIVDLWAIASALGEHNWTTRPPLHCVGRRLWAVDIRTNAFEKCLGPNVASPTARSELFQLQSDRRTVMMVKENKKVVRWSKTSEMIETVKLVPEAWSGRNFSLESATMFRRLKKLVCGRGNVSADDVKLDEFEDALMFANRIEGIMETVDASKRSDFRNGRSLMPDPVVDSRGRTST